MAKKNPVDVARANYEKALNAASVKSNPAKRIGTARPKRVSQITKRPPTKRLVARRRKNTDAGYFPNPAPVKQNVEFEVFVYNAIKKAKTGKKTKQLAQAELSYAQGLITAGQILGAFSRAEGQLFLEQLNPDGVIGR